MILLRQKQHLRPRKALEISQEQGIECLNGMHDEYLRIMRKIKAGLGADAGDGWFMAGLIQTTRLTFRGRLACESFEEFARHRALRLELEIDLRACDVTSATVLVSGQEDLVDAFEMACSLGPYDCIIVDIERTAAL